MYMSISLLLYIYIRTYVYIRACIYRASCKVGSKSVAVVVAVVVAAVVSLAASELGVGADLVDPGTGGGGDTVPSVRSVPEMAVTAGIWWV